MLISTEKAVYSLRSNGSQVESSRIYEGKDIAHIEEGIHHRIIARTNGELLVFDEGARRQLSSGVEEPITSLAILQEDPLDLLLGTEPPHIYRLTDKDSKATRNRSFDALKVRDSWYTPWGGPPAVRSLAFTEDGWVYADIHVGSIMRSSDWGETWEPVTPTLHEDVHQVSTCPAAAERVYATTYRAVYISEDRGRSWQHRADDLGQRYGRAIVIHPEDPDCILATVSDGPLGNNVHGQLYLTGDAGHSWAHVTTGFPPSTRQNINTFHVLYAPEGLAWAAVDTAVYLSQDLGKSWTVFKEVPDPIVMISCQRPRK
jgi:photosystem II stability/assembly factor-like uncharacterized protein